MISSQIKKNIPVKSSSMEDCEVEMQKFGLVFSIKDNHIKWLTGKSYHWGKSHKKSQKQFELESSSSVWKNNIEQNK